MKELREMLEGSLLEIGLRIDNIEFVTEGTNNFLRITIDRDETVDLDACVDATHVINKILDSKDPIKDKYILEVCSKQKGGDHSGQ